MKRLRLAFVLILLAQVKLNAVLFIDSTQSSSNIIKISFEKQVLADFRVSKEVNIDPTLLGKVFDLEINSINCSHITKRKIAFKDLSQDAIYIIEKDKITYLNAKKIGCEAIEKNTGQIMLKAKIIARL